ncbi:2-oxo acid dehydrogenase subunit E2 [Parapusillimonas sp. SGNA-6]|nr:2-oxo acid dehydrogenase subunit E2 [Parapusillimonas sp. SGNA-6]
MGTHLIKMPDIGEGIAEVELVEWHVQPGDNVVEDQVLADVMTDKATVQVPSPVHGKVLSLGGKVGEVLAVGADLIRLEVEGEGNVRDDAPRAAARHGEGAAQGSSGAASAGASADVNSSANAGEAAATAHAGGRSAAEAPVRGKAADTGTGSERPGATSAAAAAPSADTVAAAVAPAATRSSRGDALASRPTTHVAGDTQAARPTKSAAGLASASGRGTVPAAAGAARPAGEKPLASPAVRKRAWDLGLELQYVPGTGPGGHITHADLDNYLARGQQAAPVAARGGVQGLQEGEEQVPVIGLRRKIAEKMQESKRRIPHFTYVEEIDVTELESLRARLNAQYGAERGKLTILPLLGRAMIVALKDFPQINARYDDENGVVTRYGAVHLGIAAQTDMGLMVPVLRHAEAHDLWSFAAEVARLAEAARSGKATRDELTGSTITLTSLGALGGIVSTPVINHPEVGIVGVNRIVERPVVLNGAVVIRKIMNLSSSFDHRVVDGMHAAEFIQRIRALLECPAMLFVE